MQSIEYLRNLQELNKHKYNPIPLEKIKEYYSKIYHNMTKNELDDLFQQYDCGQTFEYQEKFLHDYLVEPFLKSLSPFDQNQLRNIYVGYLPTYDPNARAIKIPDNGPLIILHSELLTALSYYNEIQFVFHQLSGEDYNNALDFLKENLRGVVECFSDVSCSKIPLMSNTLIDQKQKYLAILKTTAQEVFVLAHEFAHIYLGHLDHCNIVNMSSKSSDINIYNPNQLMEFEADIQAVKWILNIKKGDWEGPLPFDENFISFSVEIFMLFYLVDVNLGFPTNLSHPSPIDRLKNILTNFDIDLTNQTQIFIAEMIENASYVDTFKL